MLVNEKVVEAINEQIQNEFLASAQYVAIAIYFHSEGLPALAEHFNRQSDEERVHAMKFVNYLLDAGAKPLIRSLPEVRNEFSSAEEAVQCALDNELKVTRQINDLVGLSHKNTDHMTHTFLQWFVQEQLEEVSSVSTLLQIIRHAGNALLLVEDYVRRGQLGQEAQA
ncbi:MAG: ferritin [Armatimonadetes bacterium]|nr:ferritin [Armatimonadota bacterium]